MLQRVLYCRQRTQPRVHDSRHVEGSQASIRALRCRLTHYARLLARRRRGANGSLDSPRQTSFLVVFLVCPLVFLRASDPVSIGYDVVYHAATTNRISKRASIYTKPRDAISALSLPAASPHVPPNHPRRVRLPAQQQQSSGPRPQDDRQAILHQPVCF